MLGTHAARAGAGVPVAPIDGDDVVVPHNVTLVVNVAETPVLNRLVVVGDVRLEPTATGAGVAPSVDLRAHSVVVLGSMRVGHNFTHPVQGRAFVTLFGSRMAVVYEDQAALPGHDAASHDGDIDYALALLQPATLTASGTLEWYGPARQWTRLNHTARAGATDIVVQGQDLNWQPGDSVTVAASAGDPTNATEARNVTWVTPVGSCCTRVGLSAALDHDHWVWVDAFASGDAASSARIPVDCEVGVTTRDVVVRTGRHSEAGTGVAAAFVRGAGNMSPRPTTGADTNGTVAKVVRASYLNCTRHQQVCDMGALDTGPVNFTALVNGTANATAARCTLLASNFSVTVPTAVDHDPSFGARVRVVPTESFSAGLAVAAALDLHSESSTGSLWPPPDSGVPATAAAVVAPLFAALLEARTEADSGKGLGVPGAVFTPDVSLHPRAVLSGVGFESAGQALNASVWALETARVSPQSQAATLPLSLLSVALSDDDIQCVVGAVEQASTLLAEPGADLQLRHRHAALEVAVSTVPVDATVNSDHAPPALPPTQHIQVVGCAFSGSPGTALHVAPAGLGSAVMGACSPGTAGWSDPYFVPGSPGDDVTLAQLQLNASTAERATLLARQSPSPLAPCPPGRLWVPLPVARVSPSNYTSVVATSVGVLSPAVNTSAVPLSTLTVSDNVAVGSSGRGLAVHLGDGATVSNNLVVGTQIPHAWHGVPAPDGWMGAGSATVSIGDTLARFVLTAAFELRGTGRVAQANVASANWGAGFRDDAVNFAGQADEHRLCSPVPDAHGQEAPWSLDEYDRTKRNVARHNAFGFVLLDGRAFGCALVSSYTVQHSWEVGLLAWTASPLIAHDIAAVGNAIGVSLNAYQPALATQRQVSKSLTLHMSLVAARSPGGASSDACGVGLAPPTVYAQAYGMSLWASANAAAFPDSSPNPVAAVGRVGVLASTFTSEAPDLDQYAAHQVGSFPAILGLARLRSVAFFGFGNRTTEVETSGCGVRALSGTEVTVRGDQAQASTGVALVVNPSAADVTHPHHMGNVTWGPGHTNASKLHLWAPVGAWVGASSGCGATDCGGHRHVLLQDLDGSFVGGSFLTAGASGGRARMDGTCVSIVSRADVWSSATARGAEEPPPSLMYFETGEKASQESLWRARGVHVADNCQLSPFWSAYVCVSPRIVNVSVSVEPEDTCTYRMLAIDSMDADFAARKLGPVAVLSGFARHYEWAGRANPSAIGYLDLLPSARHRCPASVPFCYHSPAAFFGIVHTASENVTVHLTAQAPPRNLRFNLLNAPSEERIVLRFGWNISYSPGSWIQGSSSKRDTNWNNLVYGAWVDGDFEPAEVSAAWGSPGQSSYFPERHTFMVVLAGGVMHQIKTGRRLQAEVELSANFETYDRDRFRERAATTLGMSTASITVLNMWRGSVFVLFSIDESGAILPSFTETDLFPPDTADGWRDVDTELEPWPETTQLTQEMATALQGRYDSLWQSMVTGSFEGTLVDPIIHFRVWGLPKYNEAPAVIGTEPTFEGLPVIEELGHGSFEFTADEFYVMENATVARVFVTRLGGGFGLTTVDYVSFSGTSNVRDGDFVGRFGRVRMAPYVYLQFFTVTINDDDQFEYPDENFQVRLEAPDNGGELGRPENLEAIVWILNDDPVTELFFDVTELDTHMYFWNPTRPFVFVDMTRINNLVGACSMLLTTVDGSAKMGVHYTNSTTALTFRDGSAIPNEFPPDGNMSITILPQAEIDARNGTYLYFLMNLSLFDNMVGPRQGRVTTIRVEFNMAAAIPQWPPVLYPAFLYLMLGTAFCICVGTGLYCRWYHKQRQPHRWYRRGHTLSSPRFEVGLNPFRNDRDLNAAGLSHAQNPPVEWHAYIEDSDFAESSDSEGSEPKELTAKSIGLSSRHSLATNFSAAGKSFRRPSTGTVGTGAWASRQNMANGSDRSTPDGHDGVTALLPGSVGGSQHDIEVDNVGAGSSDDDDGYDGSEGSGSEDDLRAGAGGSSGPGSAGGDDWHDSHADDASRASSGS